MRTEDRAMAANEDQHLAWCHDSLLGAAAALLRGFQPQHLVRRHQRPLNMIHAGVDVRHDRRKPRAAEVIARLLYRGGAGHFAKQFGGFELIGRKRDADVAVRNDALVAAVRVDDLADVLRD